MCALYWFHPLVWILLRRLNLEAERACDDAVLRQADALAYADQLVGFAEGRAAGLRPPLLALAGGADLTKRVGAVLDGARRRGRVGWGAAMAAAGAMAMVTLAVSPVRAVAGSGQQAGLRFSVASLKEWKPGQVPRQYSGLLRQDPRRVYGAYVSLSEMISYAFNLTGTERVEGLPRWAGYKDFARATHFVLDARMPAATTDAQTTLMMQSLLRRRFGLSWHWTRERTRVLELVVARGGLKLKRKDPGYRRLPNGTFEHCPKGVSSCTFVGSGPETMAEFAGLLSDLRFVARPVVDKTGLTGKFFFPHMTLSSPIGATVPVPSLPAVLRNIAGLTLRQGRDSIPMLVIDHVEKPTGDVSAGTGSSAVQRSATQAPRPHFDVVSIIPSAPNEAMVDDAPQRGGYWVVRDVPTAWLIYFTFETQPNLVVGMPKWAHVGSYDVEARMPPTTTDAEVHLMLKSMLRDRFAMRWHFEMRPTKVSVLSAGPPGPDLHPASGHCLPPGAAIPAKSGSYTCGMIHVIPEPDGLEFSGFSVTLGELATLLTRWRLRPVVYDSGSKALYDFRVKISILPPYQGETARGRNFDLERAIQAAFRKQLGLNINMAKTVTRPFPVLVIDHLARATRN